MVGIWCSIKMVLDIYSVYTVDTKASVLKTVKVTAKSGLNVRAGDSVKARKIGAVPYGTQLKVVGEYGAWYLIQYKNGFGYVYAKYTK